MMGTEYSQGTQAISVRQRTYSPNPSDLRREKRSSKQTNTRCSARAIAPVAAWPCMHAGCARAGMPCKALHNRHAHGADNMQQTAREGQRVGQ